MSSSQHILNSLPSFWRDRFEDRDLLENIYSYIGTYLGDVYEEASSQISKLSLVGTPVYSYRTWNIIPLSTIHRLALTPTDGGSSSIVIYGLREEDTLLNNCYRLYSSPDIGSSYIDTRDFSFYDLESTEINDLIQLTGNQAFFNRFSRFLVFTNLDPIYKFNSQEPELVRAYYPLAFRINNYLLGELTEDEILATAITITAGDYTIKSNILAVEKQTETTVLLVDPDAFTPFIDDSTVKISGLADSVINASVYTSYSNLASDINLWAYDCEIDNLELFRRWGFLITPDYVQRRPIRSSELYKNILEEMLEARIRGLSRIRLENIASLLAGSDRIIFSSLNDTILNIDLVDNTIISQLTTYRLLSRQVINISIVKACHSIITNNDIYPRVNCISIEILDTSIYNLLLSNFNTYGPNIIKVFTNIGEYIGDVILACTQNSLIINTDNTEYLFGGDLHIYYLQGEYINLSSSNYSYTSLVDVESLIGGELVNPQVKVFDISNGIDERVSEGLYLPSDIWEVYGSTRREITSKLTHHIVGSMPTYRIGDYELYIPHSSSSSIFDSVSDSNPQGLAWPTSYKLYKHFLRHKIALLEPANIITATNLDACVNLVSNIKDCSKRLLVANRVPLVNYVPAPSDYLEVSVNSPNIQDNFVSQSYGGIGSLGITLLLSGDINISGSDTVDTLGLLPPPSGGGNDLVEYTLIPINLIGYDQGYALVDAGYSADELVTLLNLGYSVDIVVNNMYERVTPELVTNYVGSDSNLMVVGASYPEYTSYYNFEDNTVSEWVQVAVSVNP